MPGPAVVPNIARDHVRWSDVDPVGITRYDAYMRFVELGEDALWRAAGLPVTVLQQQFAIWLPRKLLHVDYHARSRLGDRLAVVTYLSKLGETSVTLQVDVMLDDARTLVAAAQLVLVCVTRDGFAKTPLPDEVRAAMRTLVCTSDEARARAAATPPAR